MTMKNENELILYYNKFNEDKRLNTKHGQVEYLTAIKYIETYIKDMNNPRILDVGAGTGKYSLYFSKYDVSAVELVKHNLRVIQKKSDKIHAYLGNALDLSQFDDNSFDIVLLFGPMYHLISYEDKLKALLEAKRVLKSNGYIFISYCMNEYAIITHMFKENNIFNSLDKIDKNYHIISSDNDLYSFVRLNDIDKLMNDANLKRERIVSQDGASEYIKDVINKMSDDEFDLYLKYHFATCEREELLGASRHVLDILKK